MNFTDSLFVISGFLELAVHIGCDNKVICVVACNQLFDDMEPFMGNGVPIQIGTVSVEALGKVGGCC
jgi:hypothetical protein